MEKTYSERLKQEIYENAMALVYFSNQGCGACEVIHARVVEILRAYPKVKIIEIDSEKAHKLAGEYQVLAAPLMILFVEGKEVIRLGRYLDFLEFERMVDRYYGMLFD